MKVEFICVRQRRGGGTRALDSDEVLLKCINERVFPIETPAIADRLSTTKWSAAADRRAGARSFHKFAAGSSMISDGGPIRRDRRGV